MRHGSERSVCLFLVLLSLSVEALGQDAEGPSRASRAAQTASLQGRVGFASEAYAVSGRDRRRSPFETRLFANTTFGFLGMQSGFQLSYSTDDNDLRQSMNRIAFRSTYDWSGFTVGDVSPSLSRYSLRGEVARGGMFEFTPGDFQVTLVGGRNRRAVVPGAQDTGEEAFLRDGSYRRWLYAARLGYEPSEGTHVSLTGLYGIDDATSVDQVIRAAPEENFSLTPAAAVRFLDGRVSVEGEVTASAHVLDTRNTEVDAAAVGMPALFGAFVTPTTGSAFAYAGDLNGLVRGEFWDLRTGYSRIQPGFESMGLMQIRSDRETIRFQPGARLLGGAWSLGGRYLRQRNNLADTRDVTLTRHQLGLNSQARFSPGFSLGSSVMRVTSLNERQEGGAGNQKVASTSVMLTPMVLIQRASTTHSLSLSGSYQGFRGDAAQPEAPSYSSDSWTGTLSYVLTLPSSQSYTAALTYLDNQAQSAATTAANVSLGTGRSFFDDTITLAVNGGAARTRTAFDLGPSAGSSESTQLTFNLTGSYRLPFEDSIYLMLRGLRNRSDEGPAFSELIGSIRYAHSF